MSPETLLAALFTSGKVATAVVAVGGALVAFWRFVIVPLYKIAQHVADVPEINTRVGKLEESVSRIENAVGSNGGSTLFELGAELKVLLKELKKRP